MNLLVGLGIDVAEQPVVENISLNPPSKLSRTVLDEVDKLSLGVSDDTLSTGDLVGLISTSSLEGINRDAVGVDGKAKNGDSSPEGVLGAGELALLQRSGARKLSSEEGVSV